MWFESNRVSFVGEKNVKVNLKKVFQWVNFRFSSPFTVCKWQKWLAFVKKTQETSFNSTYHKCQCATGHNSFDCLIQILNGNQNQTYKNGKMLENSMSSRNSNGKKINMRMNDQRHRYRFENCQSIGRLGPMLKHNVNRNQFCQCIWENVSSFSCVFGCFKASHNLKLNPFDSYIYYIVIARRAHHSACRENKAKQSKWDKECFFITKLNRIYHMITTRAWLKSPLE